MCSCVKEMFCHSFSFAVATEQQAESDEGDSSSAHPSGVVSRRGPSDDSPNATETFK